MPDIEEPKRSGDEARARFAALGDLRPGTLRENCHNCGKPDRRCAGSAGPGHGPGCAPGRSIRIPPDEHERFIDVPARHQEAGEALADAVRAEGRDADGPEKGGSSRRRPRRMPRRTSSAWPAVRSPGRTSRSRSARSAEPRSRPRPRWLPQGKTQGCRTGTLRSCPAHALATPAVQGGGSGSSPRHPAPDPGACAASARATAPLPRRRVAVARGRALSGPPPPRPVSGMAARSCGNRLAARSFPGRRNVMPRPRDTIAREERDVVDPELPGASTLCPGLDGTGIPVHGPEAEYRAGRQPDGPAGTH